MCFLANASQQISAATIIFTTQVKGTVTRFCAYEAFWFLVWRTFFQSWLSVKKSSSIEPERPEKAMISVLKSSLCKKNSWLACVLFCRSLFSVFSVLCITSFGDYTRPQQMISQTVQISSSFIYFLITPVSCTVIKALELDVNVELNREQTNSKC